MPQIRNQYQVPTQELNWEKTRDGFLRCKLRVLSEGIMPYGRQEVEEIPIECISDPLNLFVPLSEMNATRSIRSLEGVPVVIGEHNWLTPEIIQGLNVGNVAGTPVMDGPWLCCDVLITNPDAIRRIESKELSEVSAAYSGDLIFEKGNYHEGVPYDARQVGLRYNHIAIIERGTGRGGNEVRILNKEGVKKMVDEFKVVRVQLGNTKVMINTDEEGAKFLNEEEKKTSGNMEGLLNNLEENNTSLAALQEENERLKGELSVYKEKLDAAMNPEMIQDAAENMVAEKDQAGDILENSSTSNGDSEEEKKKYTEIKNSIVKLHGENLHQAVLGHCGVKIENMSPSQLQGAFSAQYDIVKAHPKVKVAGTTFINKSLPNGPVNGGSRIQRTGHQQLGFK